MDIQEIIETIQFYVDKAIAQYDDHCWDESEYNQGFYAGRLDASEEILDLITKDNNE